MMTPERRSMCFKDWLQIVAWGVAALVFYFNSNTDVASKMAALDTRMAVSETRIAQETKGYEVLLNSFNSRMDKLENSFNARMDKMEAELNKVRR